jgi:hypothetical protein
VPELRARRLVAVTNRASTFGPATPQLKEHDTMSTTTTTANRTTPALAPEDAALLQELERVKRLLASAAQADDLTLAASLVKSWKSLAWRARHMRGEGN